MGVEAGISQNAVSSRLAGGEKRVEKRSAVKDRGIFRRSVTSSPQREGSVLAVIFVARRPGKMTSYPYNIFYSYLFVVITGSRWEKLRSMKV